MKLIGTTCYSRLLWVMCAGEPFRDAVVSIQIGPPGFEHEGITGFIETKYEIEIRDITRFARLWDSWYSLSDKRKLELYGLAKGLGDCK